MRLLAATDPLAGDIMAHVDERSWAGTVQRYASLALTLDRPGRAGRLVVRGRRRVLHGSAHVQ
jgi:hypothetical protein